MARVLVTETLAQRGLDALAEAGHEVDVRLGLTPDELIAAVPGAHALVVRSATKVTAEVLEAATSLQVVGRAGVGIDNIEVAAATQRGVMVVNAPLSISLSTAEHTMALLLSQARNVPQAHAALRAGRWEKSKWEGVELHGKTLGIVGLGRIGSLVAQRAHAFGMRIVAWDPWLTQERARTMGVELVELDELAANADFVSVHLLKTKESVGLIGRDFLTKVKPGVRIVNAARGGIVDEDALAEAVRTGHVGGAAIDVFAEEPCTTSPLFALDNVVVTPHLGASTVEAQDKAGVIIAEQVILALSGDFVPFAVNVSAAEASEAVRPYLPLGERVGRFFAELNGGLPSVLDVEYQGGLADYDLSLLTLSVLKGLMSPGSDEPVTYVNAPQLLKERGTEVRELKTATTHDFENLIVLRGPHHSVAATLYGLKGEHRIVMVDDHVTTVPPSKHMLVVRNEDRPGRAAAALTVLGGAGVNVSDFHVGRSPTGGAALMVLATDTPVTDDVVDQLRAVDGILSAHPVTLE